MGTRETPAAQRVIEAATVGEVYVRPMIDLDASDYTDEGTIRRGLAGRRCTGLLVKATPNDEGHIPAQIPGLQVIEERKRRRVWL